MWAKHKVQSGVRIGCKCGLRIRRKGGPEHGSNVGLGYGVKVGQNRVQMWAKDTAQKWARIGCKCGLRIRRKSGPE